MPTLTSLLVPWRLPAMFVRRESVEDTPRRAAPLPGPRHIPALDGVRGLAVLMVLFCHFNLVFANSQIPVVAMFHRACTYGSTGVDLFFVLSGFLITGILLDTRDSSSYFSSFYMRRTLRIFPLYFAYLAVVFFAVSALGYDWWSKTDRWAYVFYYSNWIPGHGVPDRLLNHLWSLQVEEQFYLVWPAVVYFCPRGWLGPLCIVTACLAPALRGVLFAAGCDYETLHRITPARLDTLMFGSLLAAC